MRARLGSPNTGGAARDQAGQGDGWLPGECQTRPARDLQSEIYKVAGLEAKCWERSALSVTEEVPLGYDRAVFGGSEAIRQKGFSTPALGMNALAILYQRAAAC